MANLTSAQISMSLIASAGEAKSLAFLALTSAKQGDFPKANDLLDQAQQEITKAHRIQTSTLTDEALGNASEIDLLLVHANDHLMSTMLAIELIEEIIELHKTKAGKQ